MQVQCKRCNLYMPLHGIASAARAVPVLLNVNGYILSGQGKRSAVCSDPGACAVTILTAVDSSEVVEHEITAIRKL